MRYKVILNHSRENYLFWKTARSKVAAVNFARLSLERKLGLRKGALACEFDGKKNNITVEVEREEVL